MVWLPFVGEIVRKIVSPAARTTRSVFRSTIQSLWDSMNRTLGYISSSVEGFISSFPRDLANVIEQIRGVVRGIISEAEKAVGGIQEQVTNFSSTIMKTQLDLFGDLIEPVKQLIAGIGGYIATGINNGLKALGSWGLPILSKAAFDRSRTAIEVGSPEERKVLETDLTTWFKSLVAPIEEELKKAEAEHSPITPDEAAKLAAAIGAIGTGIVVTGKAGGILAETLSLGQIESVSRAITDFLRMYGLPAMIAALAYDPYSVGIRTPYRYFLNKKFQPLIPGVSDQIRFVGKEAYPDERRSWIAGLPPEQKALEELEMATLTSPFYLKGVEWLKSLGYSDYWAEAFWHAHWVLPAVGQLFTMYHRGVIDLDTLTRMLTISDIHPAWIAPLTKIAYDVIGRIDLRRGWELGVIDDDRMVRGMQDIGYSPEDAKLLADIHKEIALDAEKGDVRKQHATFFELGFIDEDELRSKLEDLKTPKSRIDYYIEAAKLKRDLAEKKEMIRLFRELFRKDKINDRQLQSKLQEIGLSLGRAKAIVNFEIARKREEKKVVRVKRVSLGSLRSALRLEVIDLAKFRKKLEDLEYAPEDIDLLVEMEKARIEKK